MPSQWLWDTERQEYYRWFEDQEYFLYTSGLMLDRNRNEITAQPINLRRQSTSEQSQASTSMGSGTASSHYSYRNDLGDEFANMSLTGGSTGQLSSSAPAGYMSSSAPAGYSRSPTVTYANHSPHTQVTYASGPSQPQGPIAPSYVQRYDRSRNNTYVYGRIGGTHGETEKLDPRYLIRRPGHKFFTIGKVFKVLWAEPAGNPNSSVSEVFCQTPFGPERLVAKIRWFVVVLPGQDNQCQCLPINTYNNQGVAKWGAVKEYHAVVHNHDQRPWTGERERPGPAERGMLSPIRVKAYLRSDRMHAMSRVNFARTYTVEHNVKVYSFGNVVRDDLKVLYTQWMTVIEAQVGRAYQLQINSVPEEDDEDEDEEDDEEEDDDDHRY